MSAASSLKKAFTTYGEAFDDGDVRLSFAGSDELAAQIRQGVKPDVFAAANTKLPDELFKEGLVEQPVSFATNELVLAVPADGGAIASLDDVDREGVTIGDRRRGRPGRRLHPHRARRAARDQSAAILANVRSNEPDVAGIVGKLTQGAVDAGFVYRSDVEGAGGKLQGDRAARRAQADRRVRRRRSSRAPRTPTARRRSSTGCSMAPARDALQDNGFGRRPARDPGPLVPPAAVRGAGGHAVLPDAADRRDLRRHRPGRADRQPRRPGRGRRAHPEPVDERARRR